MSLSSTVFELAHKRTRKRKSFDETNLVVPWTEVGCLIEPHASKGKMEVEYEGKLYQPDCTPPEISRTWDVCEDLANKLRGKALESKRGKRADMSESHILEQYLPRLTATGWTFEAEARWIIRRLAEMLSWPVPRSCEEPQTPSPT
ncbi:MAG: hypothetical protein JWR21_2620 [Herminiimonas sp.]|nr:hypothetical protein [Herminiimonas sp.]